MGWMHPAAIEHQRRRLMRPDADAARWLPPDVARLFAPLDEPEAKSAPPPMSADEYERELASIRGDYLELKAVLAVRKFERTWAAFRAKAYNPDQPRVPAGNPDGGQWTYGDGAPTSGSSDGRRNDPRVLSDATPDNPWKPGAQYAQNGHHTLPRANYKNLPLQPETRQVFEKATSGKINIRGHQFDEFHRRYNDATKEFMEKYMRENNIAAEKMTPDQARSILRAIDESDDSRIRTYREMIKRLRLFFRLRSGGRGSE